MDKLNEVKEGRFLEELKYEMFLNRLLLLDIRSRLIKPEEEVKIPFEDKLEGLLP